MRGARVLDGLTTRGRCLLAGGVATAVCALVLDERDLLRLGALVATLPLLALLLAARTRRTLDVRRRIVPDRLPVGAAATVELTFRGGPLLAPVRLADAVPDAAGPRPEAPPRYVLHRLPADGGVLRYPLRPVLRGRHRIGPLTGRTGDPLGLAELPCTIAGADRMLVLPRVVALRGAPAALGSDGSSPEAEPGRHGSGHADVVVREYRQGDELRRVHWGSSARHDDLMVRLEEVPRRTGATLLLDRRHDAHAGRGPRSSLEFAVSLVASACAHLVARGEPVRPVTEDGAPLVPVGHGRPGALDPVLDALAALRPSARPGLDGPAPPPGGLLAVLGALRPGDLEALLARRPGGGAAVLLDVGTWAGHPADPAVTAAAAALRRVGWTATTATAATPPDQAWAALTGPAAVGVGAR